MRSHSPLHVISLVLILLGSSGAGASLRADTILRKDGSEVIGKILTEEESRIQVEVQMGKMTAKIWIPRKEIASIAKGKTPAEEMQARLAALEPHDLAGHQALAEWAKGQKLFDEERYVNSLLPRVELASRKHQYPRSWCRTCGADGEVTCEVCAGEGKKLAACSKCAGVGQLVCKTCKGDKDAMVRCRRCAGEGEYEKFDPARGRKVKTECADCRGKGERNCPTCNGKGGTLCPSCEGEKGEVSVCDVCNGKPKRVCETCAGKGIQATTLTDEQLAKEASEAKQKAAQEAAKAAASAKVDAEKAEKEKTEEPVIKGNPFGGG